jgi:hypothetical protein
MPLRECSMGDTSCVPGEQIRWVATGAWSTSLPDNLLVTFGFSADRLSRPFRLRHQYQKCGRAPILWRVRLVCSKPVLAEGHAGGGRDLRLFG